MLRANRPILAFFDAIKTLRLRQLALLLKAGYDPNLMVNARGQNGLQFMINYFGATEAHFRLQAPINKSAYLAIARLLLDSGLDANATDLLTDETALFDAIRYNDRDMVALLLNYVDLTLRNKNGETVLMCAARFGGKQVMRLMLDHLRHLEMDGYFLRQRNRFGLTALEIARTENLEAAKVLTKHLITFGQATGSVLARSVSHHQLASSGALEYAPAAYRRAPPANSRQLQQQQHQLQQSQSQSYRRRAQVPAPFQAIEQYHQPDELLSASDYDSDLLVAAPAVRGPAPLPAAVSHARASAYGYYDPKAAEFSQYLLDQQVALDSTSLLGASSRLSDGDDLEPAGYAPAGQLVRSRSCMLAGKPAAYASKKEGARGGQTVAQSEQQVAGSSSKMSASWQDRGSANNQ